MLLLDRRVGSADLLGPLERLGIPIHKNPDGSLPTLDFGDVAFCGSGPDGLTQIGIELKNIRDLLSSIQEGRLAGHQIPGMLRQYDICWLVVEGLWRPASDGLLELHTRGRWQALELGKRRYLYREVDNFITTLEMKAGLHVRRTANRDETTAVVANLYRWWNDKEWAQHRSHLALHRPADAALLVPPPLRRRIARELTGVGHEKSAAVMGHFSTTRGMINAPESEWIKIPGIGKTLARRIVLELEKE